jgi:hypothetical protein
MKCVSSMSRRMIAKICLFVISAACLISLSGCAAVSTKRDAKVPSTVFEEPQTTGNIKSAEIKESSGLASSKCQPGVFWTHNDSGDDAFIFAIDKSGNNLGTWKVAGAENIDWEDVAATKDASGKCHIYIGEIGDNKAKRPVHTVYRVEEPIVNEASRNASAASPLETLPAAAVSFSYPDTNQDAETLLVHPQTGDIYVVTKRVSGPAGIYRVKPNFGSGEAQRAESIGELSVPAIPNGFLTGGDISPDGTRVIICDYTQGYEYSLPKGELDFSKIWKQSPEIVDLGKRKGGESIGYAADGSTLFATSEGRNSPMIEVKRKQ